MPFTPSPQSLNPAARWILLIAGILLALVGLALGYGGYQLMSLGGSWYYLLTGIGLLLSGALLARRKLAAAWLFGVVFVATVIWALWESGFSFWYLVPRLAPMLVMALIMLALTPLLTGRKSLRVVLPLAGLTLVVLVVGGVGLFYPHGVTSPAKLAAAPANTPDGTGDWSQYTRTGDGKRYAPFSQINASNVEKLEVAWTFHTGDIADGKKYEDQNTPMQIGDTLYVCSPKNIVFALDVDTGKEKWKFDPQATGPEFLRCRSLGYADLTQNTIAPKLAAYGNAPAALPPATGSNAVCSQRIFLSTTDTRLIALDAKTGALCDDFGHGGTVDLTIGMGDIDRKYYFSNSGPLVIENGLIVLGGRVKDNQQLGEPSGVIRAFDARNGEVVWAWDLGNPAIDKLPPEGETYTRGTPNVWTTMSFDDKLGMIYLPLGNATPDYWGAHRTEADEKYSSAVVALDYVSGKETWHFQTVHHDIWDYDLPSQPVLADIPDGKGGIIPALSQNTKRGEIFLLDRRDGTPIADVQEKPVPTDNAASGEVLSPTQPYSVGMPAIRFPELTEKDMWGTTMFDQLACRIAFRKLRYEGDFTPQSTDPILQYPSNLGGLNWGSAAFDEQNNYLVVNDLRLGMTFWLVPQDPKETPYFGGGTKYPNYGTPFQTRLAPFYSVLGLPCTPPPFGTVTAIDLTTRKIVWQIPLGSAEDSSPLAPKITAKTHLPFPIGMPTLGGGLITKGGLVFFTGSSDYYIRAIDVRSGEIVWKDRLPVGGQGAPMTYVSPTTGRQYVVFTASGSRGMLDRGDSVIAYALPATIADNK